MALWTSTSSSNDLRTKLSTLLVVSISVEDASLGISGLIGPSESKWGVIGKVKPGPA